MLPLLFRQGPVPEPLQKLPRLQIHQLHLICMIKDRIRDPVLYRDPGNGRHDIIQAFYVLGADRGINADPGLQELPYILVSPGMPAPLRVFAGQIVHYDQIRFPPDGPVQVKFLQPFHGPKPLRQGCVLQRPVRRNGADDHVHAPFLCRQRRLEHGIRFPDSCRVSKKDLQLAAFSAFPCILSFFCHCQSPSRNIPLLYIILVRELKAVKKSVCLPHKTPASIK